MQKNERKFDFYYGNEAEQFNFYRIPKVLFTDKRFSKVSVEAKLLYGLLLDRMSLSIKNCWVDEENRVYIYFKLEDAMEFIGIGKDKAVKLFSELDSEKGCGLIIRKKQGLGKPAMIYIMNFSSCVTENHSNTADFKEFHNKENPEAEIAEVLTSEKPNSELPKNPESRLLENRTLDFGISDSNNIEINNIEINNTEINDINPILSYPKEGYNTACPEDEMVRIDEIRKTVRKNIDYELLCQNYTEK